MSSAISQKKRSIQLDFLRGIAILLVLGRHLPDIPKESSPALWLFRIWQRVGWTGVDLFFVLSGFLVSGLLFREWQEKGRVDIGRFFIRRAFKIYPAFYVMLFLSVTWIFQNMPAKRILVEALFIQNYFMGRYNIWNHTWSLAVEEHFYLFLGAFLFFLSRRKSSQPFAKILPSALLIGVGCLVMRLLTYLADPASISLLSHSHLRMDSLFFGVLISYFYHFDRIRFEAWVGSKRRLLQAAAIALLSIFFFFDLEHDILTSVLGFSLLYLGYGCVLVCFIFPSKKRDPHPAPPSPPYTAIAQVGFYSYSIYLWHIPWKKITSAVVYKYLDLPLNYYGFVALYLLMALSQGIFMAKLVEQPMLKLRDRFFSMRNS